MNDVMQIHYAQSKREKKEDISESLAACHTYVVSVALLSIYTCKLLTPREGF